MGSICIFHLGRYVSRPSLRSSGNGPEGHSYGTKAELSGYLEIVIFHCTLLALKARSPLTLAIRPSEYAMKGEKRLFRA